MKITLQKGETIEVCFADSDGQIDVKFGKNKITVKTDLPDTEGRVGTIYEEKFGKHSHIDDFTFPFGWDFTQ